MPATIGGVNVRVGVDLSKVSTGLDKTKKRFKDFETTLRGIRLERAIKGNPFGATNDYMKASRKLLDETFQKWVDSVTKADVAMDRFATKSKRNALTAARAWRELSKATKVFTEGPTSDQFFGKNRDPKTQIDFMKGKDKRPTKEWLSKPDQQELIKYLKDVKKLSPGATKGIDDLLKAMGSSKKVGKNSIETRLRHAFTNIKRINDELQAEVSKYQKTLRDAYKTQKGLEFGRNFTQARSTSAADERKLKAKQDIIIAEQRARAEIKQGINVKKNELLLVQKLIERQEQGYKLTQKQTKALREHYGNQLVAKRAEDVSKLRIEQLQLNGAIKAGIDIKENEKRLGQVAIDLQQKGQQLTLQEVQSKEKLAATTLKEYEAKQKLAKITKQSLQLHKIDLKVAGSSIEAMKRKKTAIRALRLEEARLNADIKAGNQVEKKRTALDKVHLSLMERGVKVTRQRSIVEKELNAAKAKGIASKGPQTNDQDSFLGPGWMKSRLAWFIRLRGFWAIWQGGKEAIRIVKEFEQELKNLQAVTRASNTELSLMKDTIKSVADNTAVQLTTIAQGMVKLGQAGLSVSEANDAIRDVSTLAVATMTDMTTASDLTTTAMRAWSDDAIKTKEIVDVLSNTVNNSKVTIEGLSTALQYLTGVAPQVGLSFRETNAVIGILANQGIKLSKVGTGLRSLLGELLRPSKKFREELNKVGLTIHDVDINTVEFIDIMEKLSTAGFDAENAFKGLDRRAASAISALIKNGNRIRSFSESLSEIGVASEMAATQMQSLNSKVIIMQNNVLTLSSKLFDSLSPSLKLATDLLGDFVKGLTNAGDSASYLWSVLALFITGTATSAIALTFINAAAGASKLASALTTIRVAMLATFTTPMGIAIAAITISLITLWNAVAKSRTHMSRLKDSMIEARAELKEASTEFEKFTDLTKKYNKARDEGDESLTKRLSKQDKELEKIYDLNLAREDEIELIKERNAELERGEIAKKKDFQQELAKISNAELELIKRKREIEDLKSSLNKVNPIMSLSKTFYPDQFDKENKREKERSEEDIKLAKDRRSMLESITKDIIADNAGMEVSINRIITKIKLQGHEYKILMATLKEGGELGNWNAFLEDIVEKVAIAKEQAQKMSALMEEAKGMQGRGFTTTDLDSLWESLLANNEQLRIFGENYEGYMSKVEMAFKSNPLDLLGNLKKLAPALNKTFTQLGASVVSIMKDNNLGEKITAPIIAAFEQLARHEGIREGLSGWINIGEKDINVANILTKIEDKIRNVKTKSLDVENEIAKAKATIVQETLKLVAAGEDENSLLKKQDEWIKGINEENNRNLEIKLSGLLRQLESAKDLDEYDKKRQDNQNKYAKLQDLVLAKMEETKRVNEVAFAMGTASKELLDRVFLYKLILKTIKEVAKAEEDTIDVSEAKNNIRKNTEQDLIKLSEEKARIERDAPNDREALARIELDILDTKKRQLDETLALDLIAKDRYDLLKDQKELHVDIVAALEAQKRAADPLYDAYKRITDEIKGWKEQISDFIYDTSSLVETELGGVYSSWFQGFPEAQEEAADLKGELKELERERKSLAASGLINSEDILRFAELNKEINGTKDAIDGLEDPLKNLKNAFNDFFESVIKGIADIIAQQLAANLVKGAASLLVDMFGSFGNSTPEFTPGSVSGGGTYVAKGGVFSDGRMIPMAKGGLVTKPTVFPMANGMGLMGEAGTEAVMPLTRLPNGNLGVESTGGNSVPNVEVNVINNTGKDVDANKQEPKFDGEKWVMGIVLDAANRNKGNFGRGLRTALSKT